MMKESGIHIVILCSRLDLPGGIERAVVNTANLFKANGHRVTLMVLDESAETFYPLSSRVEIHHLPVSFGITSTGNPVSRKFRFLSDVLKLRRTLKQLHPTIVIASEYPFAAASVLTGIRRNARLISWEHHHMNELEKNGFWDRVFRYTYPRLHQIVCLNPDEQLLFESLNENVAVVPNFVVPPIKTTDISVQNILTVARLNHVKGIDLLVNVAREVLTQHPKWTWKIIGHGRMDEAYMSDIVSAGLESRLTIQAPAGHDLTSEYNNASIYVLTSRNECFPMTLLEAMSHGLPCVAFDCETGPRHIIRDGVNGRLLKLADTASMAAAIAELIDDAEKRSNMSKKAIESIAAYSAEKVYELWENAVLV